MTYTTIPWFEYDEKAENMRHLLERDYRWAHLLGFKQDFDLAKQPGVTNQPYKIILVNDSIPIGAARKIERIIAPLRSTTSNYDTPMILTATRDITWDDRKNYSRYKVHIINLMADYGYVKLVELIDQNLPEELRSTNNGRNR